MPEAERNLTPKGQAKGLASEQEAFVDATDVDDEPGFEATLESPNVFQEPEVPEMDEDEIAVPGQDLGPDLMGALLQPGVAPMNLDPQDASVAFSFSDILRSVASLPNSSPGLKALYQAAQQMETQGD